MEITNLQVRDHKFYEAEVDGKEIRFSYDGEHIRGIYYDRSQGMNEDTVRKHMETQNIAASIIGIPPVFKAEEMTRQLKKEELVQFIKCLIDEEIKEIKETIKNEIEESRFALYAAVDLTMEKMPKIIQKKLEEIHIE